MKKTGASHDESASERISKRIAELGDWRGKTLSGVRALIKEADPDVVEEWKWVKPTNAGTPVWSHDGIICTGESYKSVVKLTFAKGASLKDPARLFNSSLDGNVRRAIDIREGEDVDESAFKALVREAVALNRSGRSSASNGPRTRRAYRPARSSSRTSSASCATAARTAAIPGAMLLTCSTVMPPSIRSSSRGSGVMPSSAAANRASSSAGICFSPMSGDRVCATNRMASRRSTLYPSTSSRGVALGKRLFFWASCMPARTAFSWVSFLSSGVSCGGRDSRFASPRSR